MATNRTIERVERRNKLGNWDQHIYTIIYNR